MKKWIIYNSFLLIIGFSSTSLANSETNAASTNNESQAVNKEAKTTSRSINDSQYELEYAKEALAQEQPDKALLAYERVLMYDKNNYEAKLGLGTSLYQLGMLRESQRALVELLKSNPPKNISETATNLLQQVNKELPVKKPIGYIFQ